MSILAKLVKCFLKHGSSPQKRIQVFLDATIIIGIVGWMDSVSKVDGVNRGLSFTRKIRLHSDLRFII